MPTITIRVSVQTREMLLELAASSGMSTQQILENALEVYRRQQLLEETSAAYAVLRDDPIAWEEMERERQTWDAMLGDGLSIEVGG
jgi:hypothetical protein